MAECHPFVLYKADENPRVGFGMDPGEHKANSIPHLIQSRICLLNEDWNDLHYNLIPNLNNLKMNY